MTKFLEGQRLTAQIKRLIKRKGELRIAVAYWGAGGLKLLGLNPKRKNLKIICCLKGGKSDPDLIKQFGARAKQSDRLHAKIIWTPTAAIVSSANASSNGMPEEENISLGLIEAGMLISDPTEVKAIGVWIDRLFAISKRIDKGDLEAARIARSKRLWAEARRTPAKQSLLDGMREGGKLEFDKQRIFFVFCRAAATKKETAAARGLVRKSKPTIVRTYRISQAELKSLGYYFNWPGLPTDAYLIDCDFRKRRWRIARVYKSFDIAKSWKLVDSDGDTSQLTLVRYAQQAFPYLLSIKDRRLFRKASNKLWTKARGDEDARIISVKDAAPVLLSA